MRVPSRGIRPKETSSCISVAGPELFTSIQVVKVQGSACGARLWAANTVHKREMEGTPNTRVSVGDSGDVAVVSSNGEAELKASDLGDLVTAPEGLTVAF